MQWLIFKHFSSAACMCSSALQAAQCHSVLILSDRLSNGLVSNFDVIRILLGGETNPEWLETERAESLSDGIDIEWRWAACNVLERIQAAEEKCFNIF